MNGSMQGGLVVNSPGKQFSKAGIKRRVLSQLIRQHTCLSREISP
jgi:hypothetical protein